jgi:hypothetical protein
MFGNTVVKPCERASSVIIKFDDKRGVSEFQLPLGMESFPENDYGLKKQLFFKTYQTYRKFITEKTEAITKHQVSNSNELIDQDTVTETNTEYQFKNSRTNENLSYQKLVMFDSILNSYDELKIQSLQNKLSKTDEIDYSQIHKYLHNAVYLSNNAIYIDVMDTPKRIVKDASTELVELFSYIYSEILKELDSEPNNPMVLPLANSFKEKRLFEESSLFAEDTYEDTISILKEVLDEIDRTTAYKDYDYWHFYDAVYNFLYSNNDGEWAIDNFSYIWERMCLAFAENYYSGQICLYDDFGKLNSIKYGKNFIDYFAVKLNPPGSISRYLRPDLVLKKPLYKVAPDFIEKIYNVEVTGDAVNLSRIFGTDYKQFRDIENLKIEMFKDKPRIRSFFSRTEKYPPTFTLTRDEFESFRTKAKDLLENHKSYFELATRSPNIIASTEDKGGNDFLIVDYKYMTEKSFQLPIGDIVQKGVKKQYVYELALQINRGATSHSEFWIPGFVLSNSAIKNKQIRRYSKHCEQFFQKYRISIIQLDFLELQKNYVENDI